MSQLNETYNEEYDFLFKLTIIGDSGVGKTSLLNRYVDNHYDDNSFATIGVDFKIKKITDSVSGKRVKLLMWDTAGQERFAPLTKSYYKGAHGHVVCYDTTRRETFDHVKDKWLLDVERLSPAEVKVILVGTKSDLVSQRQVDVSEAEQFCEHRGIKHVLTSARGNDKVGEVFEKLARELVDDIAESGYVTIHKRGVELRGEGSDHSYNIGGFGCC